MISDPFELLQLPRPSKPADIHMPTYFDSDFLFVGVSGSSINKFSLRPPQVLSAVAVAPGVLISAIIASEGSLVAYASIERSKYFLHLLGSAVDTPDAVSNTIEVPEEIGNLYLSSDKSKIVTVGKVSTQLTCYDAKSLEVVGSSSSGGTEKLVFSSLLVSEINAGTTFVVVSSSSNEFFTFTMVNLDSSGFHILIKEKVQSPLNNSKFSMIGSTLYKLTGSSISAFSVPNFKPIDTYHLGQGSEVQGIMALPNCNMAIVRNDEIQLMDLAYMSCVSTFRFRGKGSITLLNFSHSSSTIVAVQNNTALVGIPIVPTSGTLLESIGKAYLKPTTNYSLTDIFEGFQKPASEYGETAESQLLKSAEDVSIVLSDLKSALKNKDGPTFSEIVTYLKNPQINWVEWHKSGEANLDDAQNLVFEETDRNCDRRFIRSICEMAFLPTFKPFLPIGVAVYFLTHPLFPTGESSFVGLLKTLEKSDPILYRQALVSLAGLTPQDLVQGLLSSDEATFLDASIRLQEDYSPQQILQGVRQAFGKMRSISSLSILIERLSRYPETVGLMSPFIDTMGLLAWDLDHIRNLKNQLDSHVESMVSTLQANTAIADLFNGIGLSPTESSASLSSGELRVRSQHKPAIHHRRVVQKYVVETLTL